jgi:hypothetical protein
MAPWADFVNAGTGPLGSPFVFGEWNNGFVMGGEISEIRFDSERLVIGRLRRRDRQSDRVLVCQFAGA